MTTLQYRRLVEMVTKDGLSLVEAAEYLGISPSVARYYLHRNGVKYEHRKSRRCLTYYAAYHRKTDEIVAIGTAKEVAEQCGITVGTMRSCLTRNKGRYKYIRIDEDKDGKL